MNSFYFLILFPTLWDSLLGLIVPAGSADSSTLKLVHVLFRHGNRNPDQSSIIPNSTYYDESFYPEGYAQLTNAGKMTEYNIGRGLRRRYNRFLTNTWNINYLEARSTNVNRTKMSLELALAGLYPPRDNQRWSELPRQPIPFNYYPTNEDKETQPWIACSEFMTLFMESTNNPESLEYLKRYEELFAILKNKTGSSVGVADSFNYYFGFLTQQEVGYSLPEWSKSIYPEPLHAITIDYYYYLTNTTAARRLVSGFLLRKILSDTRSKIEGTISPSTRKVFLYSAHEMNVASMLLSLNAYKITEVPPYGSHVIFEVHEIRGIWGLKLFYQNYEFSQPIALKIPGCDYFCPFDTFTSLVKEIIPEDGECTS